MNRRSFLLLGIGLAFSGSVLRSAGVARADDPIRLTSAEVQKMTQLHNEARAAVGVGPLSWSDELAAYAQSWADHLAANDKFEHSTGSYGENLAGAGNVEEAFESWLSEKANYRGQAITRQNFLDFGHYTQIVWKDTTRFGCGKAQGTNYSIWVCSYDPAGNMVGQKPY